MSFGPASLPLSCGSIHAAHHHYFRFSHTESWSFSLKPDQLKTSIESGLPGSLVKVEDVTGTGDHFQATVICDKFVGKSLVEQHQMVYGALQSEIAGDLHAVGLKTYTPEAWEKARASSQ